MTVRALAAAGLASLALLPSSVRAHDGPPYPIVSDQVAGAYKLSVWTDPDTTDDGSPGGQFWVMIGSRNEEARISSDTRARVTATPLDRVGAARVATADPVRGDVATQFAALVLNHEGRFRISVDVDGPLGRGEVESDVIATYDLRPPPILLVVYLVPFVLVGLLWAKRLVTRRLAEARADVPGRSARASPR
jgi:hypothetical protein